MGLYKTFHAKEKQKHKKTEQMWDIENNSKVVDLNSD